jgi:two-component system copper resistance phosphate regulon response regulator CusR
MHILLIEDELKTAVAIQAYLRENNIECSLAHNGQEGLDIAIDQGIDVIVTDVIMPEVNGLDFSKSLRAKGNKTPILMISALDETDDKISGLQAGADDYLAKPFDLKELLARIRALDRRSRINAQFNDLLRFEDLELNLSTLEVQRNDQKIILTPKEFALLEYLLKNQGRVIPKLEILEKVWGLGESINTNVIEVYVNYLRKKIDRNFPTKLIQTHFGIGYYIKSEDA